MPRVARSPAQFGQSDRPGRLKLLLRRQKRLLRPAAWARIRHACRWSDRRRVRSHSTAPGGTLADAARTAAAMPRLRAACACNDVVIEGRANTPEPLLRAAIGVSQGDPILGFSVETARQRIETLSWVEHATVERRLPGTIVVHLQERRPFAIWQNQGKFVLIDRDRPGGRERECRRVPPVAAGRRRRAHRPAPPSLLDALTRSARICRSASCGGACRRASLEPATEQRHRCAAAGRPRGAGDRSADAVAAGARAARSAARRDRPAAARPCSCCVRPRSRRPPAARSRRERAAHERHVRAGAGRRRTGHLMTAAGARAAWPQPDRSVCSTSARPRSSA